MDGNHSDISTMNQDSLDFLKILVTVRFGYDKRKAHFSSLILTGQMTRSAALARLAKPELEASFWKKSLVMSLAS